MIFGLHSIIEAIEAGKDIEKIYIKRDFGGELAKTLWVKIKQHGIPCQKVPQEKLNSFTDKNHQGAVAFLSEIQYSDIADILPAVYEAGRSPFVVIMDGVTDVRNFGAIARTCECAGVDAIVIPTYRSATTTADAIKAVQYTRMPNRRLSRHSCFRQRERTYHCGTYREGKKSLYRSRLQLAGSSCAWSRRPWYQP